jgi:hypothetical protein
VGDGRSSCKLWWGLRPWAARVVAGQSAAVVRWLCGRKVVRVTAVHLSNCGGATAVRGASRSRSERGGSEVVVWVREGLRVTAVYPASCGGATAVRGINRGRSEVLVLVREVVRVTAVHFAGCGGWQRPCACPPNKGCSRRHRCGRLGLRRRWLFSRSCPGRGLFGGGAADPGVG